MEEQTVGKSHESILFLFQETVAGINCRERTKNKLSREETVAIYMGNSYFSYEICQDLALFDTQYRQKASYSQSGRL